MIQEIKNAVPQVIKKIKRLTPNLVKRPIKRLFDFCDWCLSYRKRSLILTSDYDIKMILHPSDWRPINILSTNASNVKEFAALNILTKKGGLIFDAGANRGIISIYLSQLVGKTGVVHAFEPVTETFLLLQETLAINRTTNVTPHKIALSDTTGTDTIYIPENADTLSALAKHSFVSERPIASETIETVTLDDFCQKNEIAHINGIKIDVEGFEENVLNGAKKMLDKSAIDYVQFEISAAPLASAGKKAIDIFRLLEKYGYTIYSFDLPTKKFVGPIHENESSFDNYYAVRDIQLIEGHILSVN